MDDMKKDKRFKEILRDPRFKKMPAVERKTKIDKRFQGMFEDENFKLKYSMDKRGKPWKHTTSEDLKKFYSVTSESEEEDGGNAESGSEQEGTSHSNLDEKHEAEKVPENNENPVEKGSETSSDEDSSEDDSSEELGKPDEDDIDDDEFDHKWEELDADAPVASDATRRIAICNMDWDRIRAQDIMAVFNSFKPADGFIESVKIYPSEFGLKRMEEEKLRGPTELVSEKIEEDGAEEEKTEKSQYHRERLRQYQINRLKYYYAVVECDSPRTANSLYEQLNGMEYESSAVCMDIRFIPDDMTFDQEPKSVSESVPDPSEYKPRLFVTSALQQVKVNLTWDETDPARRETLQKAFSEPDAVEKELKDYLASSSSESEADDDAGDLGVPDTGDVQEEEGKSKKMKMKDRIAAYKSLLKSFEEKEKEDDTKYDMEITWEPGLKEKTEEMVKGKLGQKNAPMTPFEERLRKKKEEKKTKKKETKFLSKQSDDEDEDDGDFFTNVSDSKKDHEESNDKFATTRGNVCTAEELALMVSDGDDSDEPLGDYERSKKKRKKKKMKDALTTRKNDGFEVDASDNRFSAIFTSHLYNIDPSDPHFKDSKGMQTIIQEKQRKRHQLDKDTSLSKMPKTDKSNLSAETSALLNSIKRKAKIFPKK